MTSWWQPRSVRVRLTLWHLVALAIVLALYAGGVFAFVRHTLVADLDRQLHEDFDRAEDSFRRNPDGTLSSVVVDSDRDTTVDMRVGARRPAPVSRSPRAWPGDDAQPRQPGGAARPSVRARARRRLVQTDHRDAGCGRRQGDRAGRAIRGTPAPRASPPGRHPRTRPAARLRLCGPGRLPRGAASARTGRSHGECRPADHGGAPRGSAPGGQPGR